MKYLLLLVLVLPLEEQLVEYADVLNQQEAQKMGWDVIRIRTVLQLGVDIPFISKFSVNPEVEFCFKKD